MKTLSVFALVGVALAFAGCGGGAPEALPANSTSAVVLGQAAAYLGKGGCSAGAVGTCLRGPGFGYDVALSQSGNAGIFQIASSNASVVTGALQMLGPDGVGEPNVALQPQSAGTATLTISGTDGMTAQLPVTVTTMSTLTISIAGFPTAALLAMTVSTPPSALCPTFEGGYSFETSLQSATGIVLQNFPAMGNGASSLCLFSNVAITVEDATGDTLVQKTVTLPIVLGKDNPASISIP